jgi:hypothetical protein
MVANRGLLPSISTATITVALPPAPRPRLPGLDEPKEASSISIKPVSEGETGVAGRISQWKISLGMP